MLPIDHVKRTMNMNSTISEKLLANLRLQRYREKEWKNIILNDNKILVHLTVFLSNEIVQID